jgi:hypothetical protein
MVENFITSFGINPNPPEQRNDSSFECAFGVTLYTALVTRLLRYG